MNDNTRTRAISEANQNSKKRLKEELEKINDEAKLSHIARLLQLRSGETTGDNLQKTILKKLDDDSDIDDELLLKALEYVEEGGKDNSILSGGSGAGSDEKQAIIGLTSGSDLQQGIIGLTSGRDSSLTRNSDDNGDEDDDPEPYLEDLEVYKDYLSYNNGQKYILIESIEMMYPDPNKPEKKLSWSNKFFCFQDPRIREQYEEIIKDSEQKLAEAKAKIKDAKEKGDYKEVKELNEKIQKLNDRIKIAYEEKNNSEPSAYNGYRIIRRDKRQHKTNLASGAAHIEVETRGLNDSNVLRIRMKSGEFLELHLDRNGNFNENEDPENTIIPLTIEGSRRVQPFAKRDTGSELIYNNYDRILEDLSYLKSFVVNGTDILELIKGTMRDRSNRQQSKNEAANHKPTEKEDDKVSNEEQNTGARIPADFGPKYLDKRKSATSLGMDLGSSGW